MARQARQHVTTRTGTAANVTHLPRESETVEWKESLGEWKEVVETAAAFATSRGGTIYVGVTRKGEVRGIADGEKTQEDIANRIAQNTDPRIVSSIRIEKRRNKDLLVIEIEETRAKPVHAFGRPFKRSGRTNQRLSPDQSAEIYMSSRGHTWDETILDDVNMSDLAMKRVRSFIAAARRERRVAWEGRDVPTKVLKHLNFVRENKPTVAALLLFGISPQQHLIQSEIRCARFKRDSDEQPIDFKVIRGTVFDQADEVIRFVERNITMTYEVRHGGPRRTDIWQYPIDAVREAVVNAICHRDYTSTANVQLRVYDESLEVWNPGLLPPGLSIKDLKRSHESKPRNKLIASAFFLTGAIERFGMGTQKILSLCRAAGLPDPEFEERAASFIVRFRAPTRAKVGKTALVTAQVGPKSGPSQAQVGQESQSESSTSPVPEQFQSLEERILELLAISDLPISVISHRLGQKRVSGQLKVVLKKLLADALIEFSIPDKPNSRLQKYRLTKKGSRVLEKAGSRS